MENPSKNLPREIIALPNVNKFYHLLQGRLNNALELTAFESDNRFTVFIITLDREETKIVEKQEDLEFIYAGIKMQETLINSGLQIRFSKDTQKIHHLKEAWEYLGKEARITAKNSAITYSFFNQIASGDLGLDFTCQIGQLKMYFADETKHYKEEQYYEKIIIESFFDVEKDLYLAIPLLGLTYLDGVVYVIFKRDLVKKLLDPKVVEQFEQKENMGEDVADLLFVQRNKMKALLRSVIREYEEMLLTWTSFEVVSNTIDIIKKEILNLTPEEFEKKHKTTTIVKDLDLYNYYKKMEGYFSTRLELVNVIPAPLYQQYITYAVYAILVDSFSHNVGAHALSTLSWWFYRRAKLLGDEELDWTPLLEVLENQKEIDNKLIEQVRRALDQRRKQRDKIRDKKPDFLKESIRPEDGHNIIHFPGSLSRELYQLLRYLTEKGAFWTGMTRDVNVGGKVSSFFSILWYDIIFNPFYIGTIAKTEDILKIRFRVFIYEYDQKEGGEIRETYRDKKYRPENTGILAEVNLNDAPSGLSWKNSDPYNDIISPFVYKGAEFDVLKKKLQKIKVYFPGGIVGRHAFYTMIENEIRNVKHYSHSALKRLQQNGLEVAIGIQESSLSGSNKKELYRISIWLNAETELLKKEGHLIATRFITLADDIIQKETKSPKLGGTYQDKVCASILLNGSFSRVQHGSRIADRDNQEDTGRDMSYYPWVRPVCSHVEPESPNIHRDYKISYNNPKEKVQNGGGVPLSQMLFSEASTRIMDVFTEDPIVYENLPVNGLLKKELYLWRGENIIDWPIGQTDSNPDKVEDNPSRYTIIHLGKKDPKTLEWLRSNKGAVRVVWGIQEENNFSKFLKGYRLWLKFFIGGSCISLKFYRNNQSFYQLFLDFESENLNFYHLTNLEKAENINPEIKTKIKQTALALNVVHRGHDPSERGKEIRYRSHGVFRSLFFPEERESINNQEYEHRMLELAEVIETKVVIFDNRIYHRLRIDDENLGSYEEKAQIDDYKIMLRDKLNIAIFNEVVYNEETKHLTDFWLKNFSLEDIKFVRECHFLVMHLSYLENLLNKNKKTKPINSDESVGIFIEEFLLPLFGPRDNFFLVITTGRGRTGWLNTITNVSQRRTPSFPSKIDFRPLRAKKSRWVKQHRR